MESIVEDSAQLMLAERNQRKAIVAALYKQRRTKPDHPNLTLKEIEHVLGVPKAEFEFSLWYLSEGQFVKRIDNGNHSLTLKGVDLAEAVILG